MPLLRQGDALASGPDTTGTNVCDTIDAAGKILGGTEYRSRGARPLVASYKQDGGLVMRGARPSYTLTTPVRRNRRSKQS